MKKVLIAFLFVFGFKMIAFADPIDDFAAIFPQDKRTKIKENWERKGNCKRQGICPKGSCECKGNCKRSIAFMGKDTDYSMVDRHFVEIESLPEGFWEKLKPLAKDIKKLALVNLQIQSLPELSGDFRLSSLEMLNLSDNLLRVFPEAWCRVKYIDLSENLLKDFPYISNWKTEALGLSGNIMLKKPLIEDSVRVVFDDQNFHSGLLKILSLPQDQDNERVKRNKHGGLILDFNNYGQLPIDFWHCVQGLAKKIEILRVQNCGLTSIPNIFGESNYFKEEFDFSHNPLHALPQFIGRLRIRKFYVHHCGLTSLPAGLVEENAPFLNVQVFDISHNPIAMWPKHMRRLRSAGKVLVSADQVSEEKLYKLVKRKRSFWTYLNMEVIPEEIFEGV